jgi:hypothetical protein
MMNAIGYAMHHSRPADAVIHVYDNTGNVIETHGHMGQFKEPKGRTLFAKQFRLALAGSALN